MRILLSITRVTATLFSICCFILPSPVYAQSLSDQIDELLRGRIELAGVPPKIEVADELIHSSIVLPLFYERRAFRPAWSGDSGPLSRIDDLINAIGQADREGLRPADYHLGRLEKMLQEIRHNLKKRLPSNPHRLADLDLLATDAFL